MIFPFIKENIAPFTCTYNNCAGYNQQCQRNVDNVSLYIKKTALSIFGGCDGGYASDLRCYGCKVGDQLTVTNEVAVTPA